MIRNMTYLLLTKVFGGVWKGKSRNNGLSTSELRVSSKTFTILDRYVSDLPSSPRTGIPRKPCLRKSHLSQLTSRNPHTVFMLLGTKWRHRVRSPARLREPLFGGGWEEAELPWKGPRRLSEKVFSFDCTRELADMPTTEVPAKLPLITPSEIQAFNKSCTVITAGVSWAPFESYQD